MSYVYLFPLFALSKCLSILTLLSINKIGLFPSFSLSFQNVLSFLTMLSLNISSPSLSIYLCVYFPLYYFFLYCPLLLCSFLSSSFIYFFYLLHLFFHLLLFSLRYLSFLLSFFEPPSNPQNIYLL